MGMRKPDLDHLVGHRRWHFRLRHPAVRAWEVPALTSQTHGLRAGPLTSIMSTRSCQHANGTRMRISLAQQGYGRGTNVLHNTSRLFLGAGSTLKREA